MSAVCYVVSSRVQKKFSLELNYFTYDEVERVKFQEGVLKGRKITEQENVKDRG
jgi:hypothetical protein